MATPPTFSAGSVLTAAQMNTVGLWLVKSQAVGSGVSSVTVSSAFNADYDDYLIKWTGGTQSADTNIRLEMGSTTTGYYGSLLYGSYAGGGAQQAGNNNSPYWTWVGGGASAGATLHIELQMPYLTKETQITARVRYGTTYGQFVGTLANSTSYTDFKVTAWSGTMTGGTISVYGYRK